MRSFVMQLKPLRLSVLAAAARAVPTGLCLLTSLPSAAASLPREVGVWIDDTGDGAVKIDVCGNALCGKIVWLRNPLNDEGKPKHDRHNPEASQQNRPICGLPVLGDLTSVPEGGFDNGWVYDPKEGKSYSVAIVAQGASELSVTGYKGIKLLGKTFVWTRSKVDLPSCAVQPASAQPSSAKTNAAAAAGVGVGAAAVTANKPVAKPAAVAAPAAGNAPVESDRLAPAPPKASAPKAQAPATTEAEADPMTAPAAAPVQKKTSPVIQKKVLTTTTSTEAAADPAATAGTAAAQKKSSPVIQKKVQTTTTTAAATKSDAAAAVTATDKKAAPVKKKPAKADAAAKPATEKLPWAKDP